MPIAFEKRMRSIRIDRLSTGSTAPIFLGRRTAWRVSEDPAGMSQVHEGVTMKIELAAPGLMLAKDQVLTLPAPEGACVTSEAGVVWITQDGDPRDIVLGAGETFCLERGT